jgi:hypothetical protein
LDCSVETSRELLQASGDMRSKVIDAYLAIPGAPSQDAVVANSELNCDFIGHCRRLGIQESD